VKVLIAEDDAFFRKMLRQILAPNYQVESVADGIRAWDALQQKDAAKLAILDWVMPGLSGPQICRNVRANSNTADCYLILLTAKNSVPDIVAGLRSGADDYLTKPFDAEELRARLRVAQRVINLQGALEDQAHKLQSALAGEKLLQSLLPVCPACKAKRNDARYWREVEAYFIGREAGPGTCPACSEKISRRELEPTGEEVRR
jgi:phosphoserine phosphatase RsbU/P